MNAMWPEPFTSHDVTKLRARRRPDGAVRAALAVHERVKAQRAHLRRLEAETDAPVTTLPFVFESELELDALRATRRRVAASGDVRQLSPIARRVWRLSALVFWVLVLIAGVVVAVFVDGAAPWSWVGPLGLGAALGDRRAGAALAALALGPDRRGHRHPARRDLDQPDADPVGARAARRDPARRLRAGVRARDGDRPQRRRRRTRSRCSRRPTPRSCASGSPRGRRPTTMSDD